MKVQERAGSVRIAELPRMVRAGGDLAADLKAAIEGEVRFGDGDRALYATDGSNYRHVPIGVVVPKTIDDVVATVAICRRHEAPLLCRGGGTSLSGETTNTAVVLDFSKYLNRIVKLDPGGPAGADTAGRGAGPLA